MNGRSSRDLVRRGLPPLAFSAASWGVLLLAAVLGHASATPSALVKWDASLYQSIARDGITLFPCGGGGGAWCGNAGWSPLFPWAMRLLHAVGVPWAAGGVALSALGELGFLAVLWNGFLEAAWTLPNALALALAAFFPAAVYSLVPFPISLFLLATSSAAWFALRERWLGAGLCAAAGVMAYSTGFLLIGVFGLWLVLTRRQAPLAELWPPVASLCGLALLGFAAVGLADRIATGSWGALFMVQAKNSPGAPHEPLTIFLIRVAPLFHDSEHFTFKVEMTAFETLFVAICMLAFALKTVREDRPPDRTELLLLIYGGAYWIFPYIVGRGVSFWRAETLLAPTALLSRRLSPMAQAMLVAVSVLLAYEVGGQYLAGGLI